MFRLCSTSIRNQIVTLIVLMSCLPLGIIVNDAVRQYRHEVDEAVNMAGSIASQIKNDQGTLLAGAAQLADVLSALPAVSRHDSQAVNNLLSGILKANPAYFNIMIADRTGTPWASALPGLSGLTVADRRYFKQAVATGQAASGEYVISKTDQVPVFSFGYPIKGTAGRVTDVLVVTLTLEQYRKLCAEMHASPHSSILLVDHAGTILFSSTDEHLIGTQDRGYLFSQMAQGPDTGSFKGKGDPDVSRIFAYRKLWLKGESSPYMYVRTGLSRDYVVSTVYGALLVDAGLLLSCMMVVLWMAIYISRKGILDKVAALSDATRSIARGDFGGSCTVADSTNELDLLGGSLAGMALQLRSTDAALQRSTSSYRELIENANSIILKWGIDGRILFYNEYAEKVFGYSADEVLGRNVMGTIVSESESGGRDLREMIRNISMDPDAYLYNENENICKDGKRVWISWNNRALTDADGTKIGILSIGQDISIRKNVEQELRSSEERFRSFVENANDIVFTLTPEGVFSYVSPRWRDAFGYDIDETVGQPFVPFVHPDDVQGCFEFLQQVLQTGGKQSGVEYRVRCKDGSFLWYTANGALIRDPDTDSITFLGIGRDISEQKKAEETLRQSEEKFSTAFRASPDAVTLTRCSDGVYLEVNEGFSHLTGYSPQEAVGKSSIDLGLWDDPGDRMLLLRQLEADGLVDNMQARFRSKNGKLLIGQMSVRFITIDSTLCLLGIIRDITEHEHLQQELIKAQKLESISILAGGIAHNFNNVLTGVIGYISYAKKHLADPGRVLPILESAEKSSYRAASLARQLLTFSKGSIPVIKAVQMDDLVQEAVSLFLTGTNVKATVDCRTLEMARVDSQQISQAFNNIILNAVHAMPDGGTLAVLVDSVMLSAGNRHSLQPGKYLKIVFEDSGCGIPSEDLVRIYDPYFTTKDSGTGLGLSTTHSIIRKHHGQIDITSEVGMGTVVTILLPSSAEPQQADSDTAAVPEHGLNGIAVLVLDDEEMIRELVKSLLEEQGAEVTACAGGEDAVDLYAASLAEGRAFSLVILDLQIPGGVGGIEAARRIRTLDPDARLMSSSGHSNDPALAEYGDYGFCGAISKPYNAAELVNAVAAAVIARSS